MFVIFIVTNSFEHHVLQDTDYFDLADDMGLGKVWNFGSGLGSCCVQYRSEIFDRDLRLIVYI